MGEGVVCTGSEDSVTDQYQRLRREGLGWIGDLFKGINRRLTALEGLSPDQVGGTRQQIIVVDGKADTAQADALAAQSQALAAQGEALAAKADALEAASNALAAQVAAAQAVLDAAQAQSEIDLGRQVDPSNLFDMRPILAQDATLFYTRAVNPAYVEGGSEPYYVSEVPNITEWFDDGFTITAPRDNYEIDLLNPVPFRAAGLVRSATRWSYSHTGAWPQTPFRRIGMRSWLKSAGQDEMWAGYDFPASNSFYDPQSGTFQKPSQAYTASPATSGQETWRPAITVLLPVAGESFTIRGPRVTAITGTVAWQEGTQVPDSAVPDDRIVRRMIAPGAVGPTELGSDVQFGPPSGGWQDSQIAGMSASKIIGSITNAMISALDAAKLTGTILLARLPAAITGRSSVGATDGQFTNLLRSDGTPWVPDTSEITAANMFTAVTGFTIISGSGRRNGNVVKFAGRAQKTSGSLAHGEMVARLATAYRGGALADQPIPGIVSGGVSGMSGTILRSNSNAVPGAINVIQPPSGNNVIEFDGTIILPAGA